MTWTIKPFLALLISFTLLSGPSWAGTLDMAEKAASVVLEDYRAFYGAERLAPLGASLVGAGLLANTSADEEAQKFYQDNLRSGATDAVSKVGRLPGEPLLVIPVLLAVQLASGDTATGKWAQETLRAIAIGGPLGLALQYSTGGGRPREGGSEWRPFKNNNGLSGHAFLGAAPFLTAAKTQEGQYIKALLYGASILPALSRINDNEHFLSQAAIGWYLAYLATDTVADRSSAPSVAIEPLDEDGLLLMWSASF